MTIDSQFEQLIATGQSFYRQGWVQGTSGNFSAVVQRDPLRVAITASGLHKGELKPDQFLVLDREGAVVEGQGKPSAESLLHLAVITSAGAGAVLHTHSIWATLLSQQHAAAGGFEITDFEMLKGLSGVQTHTHVEWVPVVDNTQSYSPLAQEIRRLLDPSARPVHGILLRRHGLYTWGKDIPEARRHVEILEFLFEVIVRESAPNSEVMNYGRSENR